MSILQLYVYHITGILNFKFTFNDSYPIDKKLIILVCVFVCRLLISISFSYLKLSLMQIDNLSILEMYFFNSLNFKFIFIKHTPCRNVSTEFNHSIGRYHSSAFYSLYSKNICIMFYFLLRRFNAAAKAVTPETIAVPPNTFAIAGSPVFTVFDFVSDSLLSFTYLLEMFLSEGVILEV